MFDAVQDRASNKQEVKIKAIKWLASPLLHVPQQSELIAGNLTTFTIYDTTGQELNISGLVEPVTTYHPYKKPDGHLQEFIRCKYFDDVVSEFSSTGCSKATAVVTLPCPTCLEAVVENVVVCRCTHLSI